MNITALQIIQDEEVDAGIVLDEDFDDYGLCYGDRCDDECICVTSLRFAVRRLVEKQKESMKEVSACCRAELYDDNEFCVECYRRNPETIWINKKHNPQKKAKLPIQVMEKVTTLDKIKFLGYGTRPYKFDRDVENLLSTYLKIGITSIRMSPRDYDDILILFNNGVEATFNFNVEVRGNLLKGILLYANSNFSFGHLKQDGKIFYSWNKCRPSIETMIRLTDAIINLYER